MKSSGKNKWNKSEEEEILKKKFDSSELKREEIVFKNLICSIWIDHLRIEII